VDDEEIFITLVEKSIEGYGYHVLVASSWKDAVQLCNQQEGSIDLLLTDLVMPQMSGSQLAIEISSLYPNIKTLFMSGYTESEFIKNAREDQSLEFIQKPFTPIDLAKKIRVVLDRNNK